MTLDMLQLLQNLNAYFKGLDRRGLIRVIGITFLAFIVIGSIIGYFTATKLNGNEPNPGANGQDQSVISTAPVSYQGIVTFLGENAYPEDNISYSLSDAAGNDIILLKASDEKLSIVQGLFVTATGKRLKTLNGKNDVLIVSEVTLKNGSN